MRRCGGCAQDVDAQAPCVFCENHRGERAVYEALAALCRTPVDAQWRAKDKRFPQMQAFDARAALPSGGQLLVDFDGRPQFEFRSCLLPSVASMLERRAQDVVKNAYALSTPGALLLRVAYKDVDRAGELLRDAAAKWSASEGRLLFSDERLYAAQARWQWTHPGLRPELAARRLQRRWRAQRAKEAMAAS
jgi:hypothetical protein